MGDGYKSLCENMGGVYLDGDTLKFNPFANVLDDTNFDASAERIRDQLSVMASPNGNLDEVHEGLLLQAVKAAWLTKHNKARIDDVVDFLQEAKDSETYADSPTIRSRLDEMIILLDQYTVSRSPSGTGCAVSVRTSPTAGCLSPPTLTPMLP